MSVVQSFCYNIDEVLQEVNSYLYQLADGKIGFIMHHFASSCGTN